MKALVAAAVLAATAGVQAAQIPSSQPTPTAPTAAGSAPARSFTAPVGLLFNTVKPERVSDFEKVIGYVQSALEKSGDATQREQAKGWRVFKAAEPGPGGTVLYVFVIDPAVPGADYGLGRILAEAYDTTQLQEIWKLYTGAVTGGGSLLNLNPVMPDTVTAPSTAPAAAPTAPSAPVERPLPPDADPNRQ